MTMATAMNLNIVMMYMQIQMLKKIFPLQFSIYLVQTLLRRPARAIALLVPGILKKRS